MSCSTKIDFTSSGRVEVCGSAFRESCSTSIDFAICSVICSAAGCSDCFGLAGVEVTGVWTNEEILLKIFVQRPRRPCSSSKSSSSIILAREGVEMANCTGIPNCTSLEGCTGVREVGACRPKP